jgi:hypothetical protein
MMSGGREGGGDGGAVKKCFLSLWPTALLSAEGKKQYIRQLIIGEGGPWAAWNVVKCCFHHRYGLISLPIELNIKYK